MGVYPINLAEKFFFVFFFRIIHLVLSGGPPEECSFSSFVVSFHHCTCPNISIYYLYFLHCAHTAASHSPAAAGAARSLVWNILFCGSD